MKNKEKEIKIGNQEILIKKMYLGELWDVVNAMTKSITMTVREAKELSNYDYTGVNEDEKTVIPVQSIKHLNSEQITALITKNAKFKHEKTGSFYSIDKHWIDNNLSLLELRDLIIEIINFSEPEKKSDINTQDQE